ncbi:hypothetical protein ACFX2I_000355 [Malus domestica]
MFSVPSKNDDDAEGKMGAGCLYVKVNMDGAPYLRKVDLKIYGSYLELSLTLEKMFNCFTIGHCGSHGASRDGGALLRQERGSCPRCPKAAHDAEATEPFPGGPADTSLLKEL